MERSLHLAGGNPTPWWPPGGPHPQPMARAATGPALLNPGLGAPPTPGLGTPLWLLPEIGPGLSAVLPGRGGPVLSSLARSGAGAGHGIYQPQPPGHHAMELQ
jgi:hypothetical protein